MELTLDQALQKGVEAHKAGKVQEADRYYTAILKANPKHPDANHNMGVLTVGVGKFEAALPFFKTALEINPNIAQFWLSYIDALIKLDRMADAKSVFDKAKSIGIKADRFDQIEQRLGSATSKNSKAPEPPKEELNALIKLYNRKRFKQVFNKAQKLTKRYTKNLTLWNLMGASAAQIGQLDVAILAFQKALTIKPDHAGTYNNTTALLKTYSPKSERYHDLFNIDSKIKKLSPKILYATSNEEIIDSLAIGLSYITEERSDYKTPLSQIYKRNTVDLNCKRHKKIFDTKDIIPQFCFGCFKVQVEVATVIDLVKITSLFYKFDFEEDLTRKTIIELRPNISGYYKGYIYCRGLDQAKAVKSLLDVSLTEIFGENTISQIKRGCSEYSLKFQEYGEIDEKHNDMMSFPKDWELIEKKFDQHELIKPSETTLASLSNFCLSDFYIIQKWIDYAKGIEDRSVKVFNDRPIIFEDIYELAKQRITC